MTATRLSRIIPRRGAVIALALLAILLVVGLPDRASAQDQVLVSNIDQARIDTTSVATDHAQQFTTGEDGYILTSVELYLTVPDGAPVRFNVAIHEVSNDAPGTHLATLTAPATLSNGLNEFTHAGLRLAPSTSYFVFIDHTNLTSRGHIYYSDADLGESGAEGWSIADRLLFRARSATGAFTTLTDWAITMRINGAVFQSQVLVSNIDEQLVSTLTIRGFDIAQQFTTGSAAGGYTLTSVELDLHFGAGARVPFTVAVHANNSGQPGARLATLTAPQTLATGYNKFTHSGLDLDPSTTYLVVVDSTSSSGTGSYRVTASHSENGAAGWSIHNVYQARSSSSSGNYLPEVDLWPLKMRINGVLKPQALPSGCAAAPIEFGTYAGELTSACGAFFRYHHDDGYARHASFSVTGSDTQTVVLTMTSSAFDTQLYLAEGRTPGSSLKIDGNNDIGWDPLGRTYDRNSRLVVDLEPGDYIVEMTSAAENKTGRFTLTFGNYSSFVEPVSPPSAAPIGLAVSPTGMVTWKQGNPEAFYYMYRIRWASGEELPTAADNDTRTLIIESSLCNPSGRCQYQLPDFDPTLHTYVEVGDQLYGSHWASASYSPPSVSGTVSGDSRAPQNVRWATTHDSLTITWSPPAAGDYDGYRVDGVATRINDNGVEVVQPYSDNAPGPAVDLGRDAGSYETTGLAPGQRYRYRVWTIDDGSPVSWVTFSFTTPQPPSELMGLTVVPVSGSASELDVSWERAKGAAGYMIQWKAAGDEYSYTERRFSTGSTSYRIEDLEADTRYEVKVTPRLRDGRFGTAAETAGTTNPPSEVVPPPSGPSGLSVSPVAHSATALDVSWQAVRGARSYEVEWKTGDGEYTDENRASVNPATSHRIEGLSPETSYDVRVTAVHPGWQVSSEATGTTHTDPPPAGMITGLSAVAHVSGENRYSITVRWDPWEGADYYYVKQTQAGSWYTGFIYVEDGGATFTVSDEVPDTVRPGTTYTYEVMAKRGPRGADVTLARAVTEVSTPHKFSGVTVTPVEGRSDALVVSWDPVPGAATYHVDWRTPAGSGSFGAAQSRPHTVTSYRITGLIANSEYEVRLRYQSADHAFGPYATARGAVPALTVTGVEARTNHTDYTWLNVRWRQAPGATHHRVEYREGIDQTVPFTEWDTYMKGMPGTIIGTTDLYGTHISGLKPSTTYTVRVVALYGDPNGVEMGYGEAIGRTHETFGPLTVQSVEGDGDKLDVSWPSLGDMHRYDVHYRRTGTGEGWTRAHSDATIVATSYRISGLVHNTDYTVRVRAYYVTSDGRHTIEYGRARGAAITSSPGRITDPGRAPVLGGSTTIGIGTAFRWENLDDVDGRDVTGYTIQWSWNLHGPWKNLDQPGTGGCQPRMDTTDPNYQPLNADLTRNSDYGKCWVRYADVGWQIGQTRYFRLIVHTTGADSVPGPLSERRASTPGGGEPREQLLVNNWLAVGGSTQLTHDFAQQFTTGASASGYTLTGVRLNLSISANSPPITVAIHDDSSGNPGTRLATMTATHVLSTGENLFTHAGVDLTASTSYFVVLDVGSGGNPSRAGIRYTFSTGESGAPGWTIGNHHHSRPRGSTGGWSSQTFRTVPRIMVVDGFIKPSASGGEPGGQQPTDGVGAAALTGLTVDTVSGEPTQLAVSWDAVDSAAKYSVRWKTGSDDYGSPQETTASSYTITGLSPNTTYTVNVAALDASNTLLAESVGSGDTALQTGGQQIDEPAALEGLTVSPVSGETTELAASWNAVTDADRYLVQWKSGAGDYNDGATVTANSHAVTGLSAGTAYTVRVTAVDTDADPDAELAVGEANGTTLAAMGTVTVAAVTDSSDSLDVSWPSVNGATGYTVEYKASGGSYTAVSRSDATATSERVTGLQAETSYTVRVTARHAIGGAPADGDSAEGSGTTNAAAQGDDPPSDQPAAVFVIYYDPSAGDAATDRYNQAVKLLTDAGIAYTEVVGDVQADVDRLAGVTDSIIPRFFLGDPTADGWTSQPKVNNGGLRWLKGKVAEMSGE